MPGASRRTLRARLKAFFGPSEDARDPVFACAFGGLLAGLVDVVAAAGTLRFGSIKTRALHGLWDVALLVGLGVFADAVFFALRRTAWKKSRALFWLVLGTLLAIGMRWVMERIFSRQADALLGGRFPRLLYPAFVIGAGLGVTLLWALSAWFSRRRRVWLGAPIVLFGLATLVLNERLFRDDYMEGHTAAVWCAAIAIGVPLQAWLDRLLSTRRPWLRYSLAALTATMVVIAAIPPPNYVRLALFRSPGGVGAWVFANSTWTVPRFEHPAGGQPPAGIDPRWLSSRVDDAPRPPSQARLVAGAPVVVVITVDAVRADDVLDPANAAQLKTLTTLMKEGVTFTHARSAGSQTAVSLSAMFAGKYFSEMFWEKYGSGANRFEYAAKDPTTRFPALLSDAGVSTAKIVSLMFLRNDFGVAPGFTEETVVTSGRRHARASEVIDPLLKRLESVRDDEPLFLYAHLTEPHAPYDRGKVKVGPLRGRYISEIAAADAAIGRVLRVLSAGNLAGRSMLVVSSDHGEAFGEHGTHEHTKTIYEELVRVPLIVWGGGIAPHTIDEPVSLVDLGPTLLDIFGVDTPAWSAGESLVPLLADARDDDYLTTGARRLTRPILAEGRLRRALVTGDMKVIVDLRRKTIEAYDIAADPGELDNIYDRDRARALPLLYALQTYFERRGYHQGGYEPIYKP